MLREGEKSLLQMNHTDINLQITLNLEDFKQSKNILHFIDH